MANDIKLANAQTKSHWETMQQWRIDEGKNYARSRANAINRMAASGMKSGSAQWEENLARVETSHKKNLERQASGATQQLLDKWTKDMKDFYIDATKTSRTSVGSKQEVDGEYGGYKVVASPEGRALEKAGEANLFTESGLSKAAFKKLSTEEFMELQFGYTDKYKQDQDFSGERAAAETAETQRRKGAQRQVQRASPWWG